MPRRCAERTRTRATRCPNRAVRYSAAGARLGHPIGFGVGRASPCATVSENITPIMLSSTSLAQSSTTAKELRSASQRRDGRRNAGHGQRFPSVARRFVLLARRTGRCATDVEVMRPSD